MSLVRRALFLGAHLGGNMRSSRDKVFRECFMRVVWLMLICWSNNFKIMLIILIEDEIRDFRADSGILREGAAQLMSPIILEICRHQFDRNRSIYDWMVDCVDGLMCPGQCTLRMLRGYTSLLREQREGENRIFWKEEEDFRGKHRRRFTSGVLPRAKCHNQIYVAT